MTLEVSQLENRLEIRESDDELEWGHESEDMTI